MATVAHPTTRFPPVPTAEPDWDVLLMVAGALLGLLGLTLAGLATAAAWAAVQQRDGGFITAPTQRYAVDSYALTTTDLDVIIDDEPPSAARPDAARVVVRATPANPAKPVFVGIAPQAEVAAYLSDVEHSELTDVRFAPFRATYRAIPGSRTPEPPGRQTFWVVSAEGTGPQQAETALRTGNWAVVVMNATPPPGRCRPDRRGTVRPTGAHRRRAHHRHDRAARRRCGAARLGGVRARPGRYVNRRSCPRRARTPHRAGRGRAPLPRPAGR